MHADRPLRLTSLMGVARAMLGTFEPHEAVEVLVAEFGWDSTVQALLLLRGDDAGHALLLTLEQLVFAPLRAELADLDDGARP